LNNERQSRRTAWMSHDTTATTTTRPIFCEWKAQKKKIKKFWKRVKMTRNWYQRRNNSAVYTLDFLSHREEAKLLFWRLAKNFVSLLAYSYMFHDDCSYM
jgi:hypothetical protein